MYSMLPNCKLTRFYAGRCGRLLAQPIMARMQQLAYNAEAQHLPVRSVPHAITYQHPKWVAPTTVTHPSTFQVCRRDLHGCTQGRPLSGIYV